MFPYIKNISEVLPAIQGSDEFVIKTDHRSGIMIVNYLFSGDYTFPNPQKIEDPIEKRHAYIRRECRGLKFDLLTGDIVTRPHPKFFNVNEKSETKSHLIDWMRPHVILEKLDGSFITDFHHRDGHREWHTKMGLTDVAKQVVEFVKQSHLPYGEFCDLMRLQANTAIFEWCSPEQHIVVDYSSAELILTCIRNLYTGQIMPYRNMMAQAQQYGLPCVKAIAGNINNISEFLSEAYELVGAEGYVVRFDEGDQYKVKGKWYCKLHDIRSMLEDAREVWKLVLLDKTDDVVPYLNDSQKEHLEKFSRDLMTRIKKMGISLEERVAHARELFGDSRAAFANEFIKKSKLATWESGLLYRVHSGENSTKVIIDFALKHTFKVKELEVISQILDINWYDYHGTEDYEG